MRGCKSIVKSVFKKCLKPKLKTDLIEEEGLLNNYLDYTFFLNQVQPSLKSFLLHL